MIRILLVVLLIIIVLLSLKLMFRIALFLLLNPFNIRSLIGAFLKKNTSNTNNNEPGNKNQTKMVKCTTCQLFIPENKAYYHQGKSYCCKEHAKN